MPQTTPAAGAPPASATIPSSAVARTFTQDLAGTNNVRLDVAGGWLFAYLNPQNDGADVAAWPLDSSGNPDVTKKQLLTDAGQKATAISVEPFMISVASPRIWSRNRPAPS